MWPHAEPDRAAQLSRARLGTRAISGCLRRRLAPRQVEIDMFGRDLDCRVRRAAEIERHIQLTLAIDQQAAAEQPMRIFAVRPRQGDFRESNLSSRRRRCGTGSRRVLLTDMTATTVDADRHVAGDGHAPMQSRLFPVVVDRDVLSGAVIPNRNVADRPSPSDCVFQTRHVSLQQRKELLRIGLRQIDKVSHERAQHQSALAGLRMNSDDGMLGFIDGGSENLEVAFQPRAWPSAGTE